MLDQVAWPRSGRLVAAGLVGFAGLFVAQLGTRVVLDAFDGGGRATPRDVVWGALLGVVLPFAVVAALRRVFRARPVPDAAEVVDARAWRLPLPGPGETRHSAAGAASVEGPPSAARTAGPRADTAMRAFSAARFAFHRRGAWALGLKYGLFPLLPAAVLFRAYQHITFGGWNGEYQLFGLKTYLTSASLYWTLTLAHLIVLAGLLRVAAELACYSAAFAAPSWARGVRWAFENLCRVLYYLGVPAALALRFLT